MEPKIEYILVADSVIIDSLTSKSSVIGIFEHLTIPPGAEFALVPSMTVFAKVSGLSGSIKSEIRIVEPDGATKASVFINGVTTGVQTINLRAIFQNTSYSKRGNYVIKVFINDEEVITENTYFFIVK